MVGPARGRNAVLLTIAAAVVVLAGCGTAEPPGPFPERPEDIDVSRLDPCALMTPARQAELGVAAGVPTVTSDVPVPTRDCRWSNRGKGLNYFVNLADVDASMTAPRGAVEQVEGYGAVRIMLYPEGTPICALAMDAQQGKAIMAQVQSHSTRDGGPRPMPEVCQVVTELAADVIDTARSIDR